MQGLQEKRNGTENKERHLQLKKKVAFIERSRFRRQKRSTRREELRGRRQPQVSEWECYLPSNGRPCNGGARRRRQELRQEVRIDGSFHV